MNIISNSFSVDSQAIVIGSDDTSNDFTDDKNSGDYKPSTHSSDEIKEIPKSMELNEFADLVKKYEAKRMKHAAEEERMGVSGESHGEVDQSNNPVIEDEETEWPVERWLRLQREEEMENASPAGRLTAPPKEVRNRYQKKTVNKTKSDSANMELVDELRAKQLQLVDEQIYLQKVLQVNALYAQEEAKDRSELAKRQLQMAEIELELKKKQLELLGA